MLLYVLKVYVHVYQINEFLSHNISCMQIFRYSLPIHNVQQYALDRVNVRKFAGFSLPNPPLICTLAI